MSLIDNFQDSYPLILDTRYFNPSEISSLSRKFPIAVHAFDDSIDYFLQNKAFSEYTQFVHIVDNTDRSISSFSYKQRHILYGQSRKWQTRKIKIRLAVYKNVSSDELWHLYYYLYVPNVLRRGYLPYSVSTFPSFLEHLKNKLLIVIYDEDTVCALYVFQLKMLNTSKIAVGTIKALNSDFLYLSRWAMLKILSTLYDIGIPYISYGGDEGIIDKQYIPVIKDKLYWGCQFAIDKSEYRCFISPKMFSDNFRFLSLLVSDKVTLSTFSSVEWSMYDSSFLNFKDRSFAGFIS